VPHILLRSSRIVFIHNPSHISCAMARNSASALDQATKFCFLLLQATRFPPRNIKYLEIEYIPHSGDKDTLFGICNLYPEEASMKDLTSNYCKFQSKWATKKRITLTVFIFATWANSRVPSDLHFTLYIHPQPTTLLSLGLSTISQAEFSLTPSSLLSLLEPNFHLSKLPVL
ncbi:hypothetical protein CR513_03695, partial [Mucuna pruriens]